MMLRPYNPEGVSFIHDITLEPDTPGWQVGRHHLVSFDPPAEHYRFSDYRRGDVQTRLFEPATPQGVHCNVGMATDVALFAIESGRPKSVRVRVPLEREARISRSQRLRPTWRDALQGAAPVRLPDRRLQFLYEAAVRSLILHTPGEVYPGPYTYKRFWFRDAAFILHSLLCIGLVDRVERALNSFLREEGDRLVLASGIFPGWIEQAEPVAFGPAPTTFGEVSVSLLPRGERVEVRWQGEWRGAPPIIEVCLPGVEPITAVSGQTAVVAERKRES